MTIYDLQGEYEVEGTNQDQERSSYKGILQLTLDENEKICATWKINNLQTQYGNGFFQDDILVINFNYTGYDNEVLKGVVVYRFINKNELRGFWSEKHGDQRFLGNENCKRINKHGKFSAN